MESIPIRKFLREYSYYLKRLPVQITRSGTPVAVVFPYGHTSDNLGVLRLREQASERNRTEIPRVVQSSNTGELAGFHG